MPYKHNHSRRHKIEKARYKVTNWPEYNNALRQRGDIAKINQIRGLLTEYGIVVAQTPLKLRAQLPAIVDDQSNG